MAEQPYRIRVRRGDIEFEVVGDKEFTVAKAKDLESTLLGHGRASPRPAHEARIISATGLPKTMKEKLARLRDEAFFSEPKASPDVTAEFRTRGWGVFKSNYVSKALLVNAPALELRRIPLGKNRFAYTYP